MAARCCCLARGGRARRRPVAAGRRAARPRRGAPARPRIGRDSCASSCTRGCAPTFRRCARWPARRTICRSSSTRSSGATARWSRYGNCWRNSRLLTLLGMGGLGKSRLSMQVAAIVLDDYPDGVWFVELARTVDPQLVPQAIASVLGVKEEPGSAVLDALVRIRARQEAAPRAGQLRARGAGVRGAGQAAAAGGTAGEGARVEHATHCASPVRPSSRSAPLPAPRPGRCSRRALLAHTTRCGCSSIERRPFSRRSG